ncbi:hypothetical protein BDN70DRAFT_937026 [Pholiota conissans]|uniref:Uncharacterized protein n=1 Tax=Pholiota conissans TaxID=109636 RepID=A0A9P5YR72_9AGAR|nr:hypothetical protein BDN70DRAFT_937026 [Pholiota conissans]
MSTHELSNRRTLYKVSSLGTLTSINNDNDNDDPTLPISLDSTLTHTCPRPRPGRHHAPTHPIPRPDTPLSPPPPSKKVKDNNATHNLHRERFPPSHSSSFAVQRSTFNLQLTSCIAINELSQTVEGPRTNERPSERGVGGKSEDPRDNMDARHRHRPPNPAKESTSPSPPENLEHPHFRRSQWKGEREEDPSSLSSPYRRHHTRHFPRFLLSRSFLAPSIHPSILARINTVPPTLVGISVLDVLRVAVLRPPSFGVDLPPSTFHPLLHERERERERAKQATNPRTSSLAQDSRGLLPFSHSSPRRRAAHGKRTWGHEEDDTRTRGGLEELVERTSGCDRMGGVKRMGGRVGKHGTYLGPNSYRLPSIDATQSYFIPVLGLALVAVAAVSPSHHDTYVPLSSPLLARSMASIIDQSFLTRLNTIPQAPLPVSRLPTILTLLASITRCSIAFPTYEAPPSIESSHHNIPSLASDLHTLQPSDLQLIYTTFDIHDNDAYGTKPRRDTTHARLPFVHSHSSIHFLEYTCMLVA